MEDGEQKIVIEYHHEKGKLNVTIKEMQVETVDGEERRTVKSIYTYFNNFPTTSRKGSIVIDTAAIDAKEVTYYVGEGEHFESEEEMEYICKKLTFESIFENTERLI
jgi:hypothetical protein